MTQKEIRLLIISVFTRLAIKACCFIGLCLWTSVVLPPPGCYPAHLLLIQPHHHQCWNSSFPALPDCPAKLWKQLSGHSASHVFKHYLQCCFAPRVEICCQHLFLVLGLMVLPDPSMFSSSPASTTSLWHDYIYLTPETPRHLAVFTRASKRSFWALFSIFDHSSLKILEFVLWK